VNSSDRGEQKLASTGLPTVDRVVGPDALSSSESSRIESIDIFRGLNVLVMIFVDNLGFVTGLAWWTYHMPREANGMTYVDMVFPAFLFLMGMSIPLSIRSGIAKGQTYSQVWTHVVVRSLSLVALGLFIANAPQIDVAHTGISEEWWASLGFVAIGLGWIRFRGSDRHGNDWHKTTSLILRCGGVRVAAWVGCDLPQSNSRWEDRLAGLF
jgi:heparan-alpha-glucosaminide N-acetyltransferase